MKQTKDFIVDTMLGEKSYDVAQQNGEEKITLAIEEGATPVAALQEAAKKMKEAPAENIFKRLDNAIRSLGNPQAKDKATFFRLMAVMVNAGVPLIRSLETIAEQTVNYKLKTAAFEIARDIETGGTLSAAMMRYPAIFTDAEIGMIKSGEASGQLNTILKQLAQEVEKSASIRRKVKGAMMYPTFIVIVMLVVVAGMMIFVVPKMAQIFMESGKELPALTTALIKTSAFMNSYWPFIFGGIFGVIFAVMGAYKTEQGKYTIDWILLHLPVFGKMLQMSILARFSRSLGNLLNSGIPIIQSLNINAKGLGNEVYRQRIELAAEDVSHGIGLAESLRDLSEFPTMMVQMISVGEQTAQLDTITAKIAEYYEDEVDTVVQGLSKALEPVIIVVLGAVVGVIIAAIMLPIIQMADMGGVTS
ncbi:type II secretion system F family protein [Candidatus Peregrinibacteria bacterium]|nr:type II secretion system F family protein [Candidatus Peregrinibacteria bacterium]